MIFVNRNQEIIDLQDILNEKGFQLIIIYGRRRVGKTELVLKTTEQYKRVYYLAIGEQNLPRFYKVCSQFDDSFHDLKPDYEVLFTNLKQKADVVILDEFQNMIYEDKNILNLFQSIIDLNLKDSNLKMIIIGSSVSMITSKVLSYKSPLYGRRTGSMNLKPIDFYAFREFFPGLTFEEYVEIFGFADGIPYYLNQIEPPFWNWLEAELDKTTSIFKDEVDFLMRYEFSKPGMYKTILEAIARGKTKLNEIKDFIQLKRTDISPYLKNLIEVQMIFREVPITENINSRRGRYHIKDNFLRFWFRFIYPHLSRIEERTFNIDTIKKAYSAYLGKVFEQVVKNFIIKTKLFEFDQLGRWWWRDKEIDLVGLDEKDKKVLFVECKWQDQVNALRVMKNLKGKSSSVRWHVDDRIESYLIFARSFYKKVSQFENVPVECYDLADMAKLMG